MLIRFTVENWLSFRDSVTFSMIATRERQHKERISKVKRYQLNILPIAAIYGGNASGKSNFFKALKFARQLVVKGTQPESSILVEPFRLNSDAFRKPSKFEFLLLIDEKLFEFSFEVGHKKVEKERLVKITSSSETILYDRYKGEPHFDDSLKKNDILKFAFRGTRDNQLFLTNSVSQNVDEFRPIWDWFKKTLVLIDPDTVYGKFHDFIDESNPLSSQMNEVLPLLDTGISRLGGEDISYDKLNLPEPIKNYLNDVREDQVSCFSVSSGDTTQKIVATRKDDELKIKKLIPYHHASDGREVMFEISDESDGSNRVIDLLPAFISLISSESKKLYVIDEIDRSLHSLLTRQLIRFFLENIDSKNRSQLIFTTHDLLLMDQSLMRRDEMWVTERDSGGASKLFALSDFKKIRYDKDLRKSYLLGGMGGIPRILLDSMLPQTNLVSNTERVDDETTSKRTGVS